MSDLSTTHPKGFWLAIAGAILQLFPLRCMIGLTITASQIFVERGKHPGAGVYNPNQFSALIGETLIAISVGMLVALVGAFLILIAVYPKRYRAPWLFWLMVILGVIYLPALPLGTLTGLGFLLMAFTNRRELLATQ